MALEKESFASVVFAQVYIQVALYSGVLIRSADLQCIIDLNYNDSGHTNFCAILNVKMGAAVNFPLYISEKKTPIVGEREREKQS